MKKTVSPLIEIFYFLCQINEGNVVSSAKLDRIQGKQQFSSEWTSLAGLFTSTFTTNYKNVLYVSSVNFNSINFTKANTLAYLSFAFISY
jgi:hypothetical protein